MITPYAKQSRDSSGHVLENNGRRCKIMMKESELSLDDFH